MLLYRYGRGVPIAAYLALGESISIDDYTGVAGGGAPSQLARRLGADLTDLTRAGARAGELVSRSHQFAENPGLQVILTTDRTGANANEPRA